MKKNHPFSPAVAPVFWDRTFHWETRLRILARLPAETIVVFFRDGTDVSAKTLSAHRKFHQIFPYSAAQGAFEWKIGDKHFDPFRGAHEGSRLLTAVPINLSFPVEILRRFPALERIKTPVDFVNALMKILDREIIPIHFLAGARVFYRLPSLDGFSFQKKREFLETAWITDSPPFYPAGFVSKPLLEALHAAGIHLNILTPRQAETVRSPAEIYLRPSRPPAGNGAGRILYSPDPPEIALNFLEKPSAYREVWVPTDQHRTALMEAGLTLPVHVVPVGMEGPGNRLGARHRRLGARHRRLGARHADPFVVLAVLEFPERNSLTRLAEACAQFFQKKKNGVLWVLTPLSPESVPAPVSRDSPVYTANLRQPGLPLIDLLKTCDLYLDSGNHGIPEAFTFKAWAEGIPVALGPGGLTEEPLRAEKRAVTPDAESLAARMKIQLLETADQGIDRDENSD